MLFKNTPHNILIDLNAESQGQLLGNSATAPARIELFDFNECLDEFRRRSLRPRLSASFRREQTLILSLHQRCMEGEDGGRLQCDRNTEQPAGIIEEYAKAGDDAVQRAEVGCALVAPVKDHIGDVSRSMILRPLHAHHLGASISR